MKIDKSVLKDFISSCGESINWTKEELEKIYPSLEKISFYNGGRIVGKGKLEPEVEKEFFLDRLEKAIQKLMNRYADVIDIESGREKYHKKTGDFKAAFNSLSPSMFVDKVNINTADIDELVQLERIGKASAEKIVKYREEHGPFKNLEELNNVEGIGPSHIEVFSYAANMIAADDRPIFISPLLLNFKKEPNISNYLKVIQETGGIFSTTKQPEELSEKLIDEKEYKRIIINEFLKMADYMENSYYPLFGKYASTKRNKVNEWNERRRRVQKIEKEAQVDNIKMAILDGAEFYPFMLEILEKAAKKIHIVMFLMHYEEKSGGGVRNLLDKLVSKKRSGLDVKVILDRAGEEDDYGSNIVNEDAYNFLVDNGIPVLLDHEEIKTHTKLVLIDDGHVVIGSHNWTASSFFRYDDKSVYLQSKDFSTKLSSYFAGLWDEYS